MRILLGALMLATYSPPLGGQTDLSSWKVPAQGATEQHDGQHHFDFEIGTWKIHVKRLFHLLAGWKTWASGI